MGLTLVPALIGWGKGGASAVSSCGGEAGCKLLYIFLLLYLLYTLAERATRKIGKRSFSTDTETDTDVVHL